MIIEFDGKKPQIDPTAFIAPTATIIGDVRIGAHASVFYGAVLRGDINTITVGDYTNIQDNAVLHVDRDAPCTLGHHVTVGHLALVHGTTIGDNTLVGMHSAVLSRSVVGAGSLIAAGAVILEGQEVPEKSLVAGVPGKVKRVNDRDFIEHAERYARVAAAHRAATAHNGRQGVGG
ncbi:MAG: gamma carbonic anhydrase family protein [Corynebacterium sp.]|nr:gamma carbonic anhydrase family protein [Corynebacterium sp.]